MFTTPKVLQVQRTQLHKPAERSTARDVFAARAELRARVLAYLETGSSYSDALRRAQEPLAPLRAQPQSPAHIVHNTTRRV